MIGSSSSVKQYQDYRTYLSDCYRECARTNPSFSMRSFARKLRISPAMLSSVLAGKRNLSLEKTIIVANQLKLESSDKKHFCDLVQKTSRNKLNKSWVSQELEALEAKAITQTEPVFTQLSADELELASTWHFWVILEWIKIEPKLTIQIAASTLGISIFAARASFQALERLGHISVDPETKQWRCISGHLTTSRDVPSEKIRALHKDFLSKSIEALENQPLEKRDFGTLVIRTTRAAAQKVFIKIQEFRRELLKELESDPSADEIYVLSTQLYSITALAKEEDAYDN